MLDGTVPTPIRPTKPLTLEEKQEYLEMQQIAMAASVMRSMSAVDKYIVDTEPQLRWLTREVRSLQVSIWLLSALNVFLLAALGVLLLLFVRMLWG